MADDASSKPTRRRPTMEWLSITQYAHTYGVHRQTVMKWIDNQNNGGRKMLTLYRYDSVIRIKNTPPSS